MTKILTALWLPLLLMILATILTLLVSAWLYPLVVLAAADIRARDKERLKLGGMSELKQWPYMLRLKSSWCGRAVAKAHHPKIHWHYHGMGYRWYHIFPDGAPMCFFRLSWWRKALR